MNPRYRNVASLTVLIFVGLFCYAGLQWKTVNDREAANQTAMTLWFANQANFEAQRTTLALYQLASEPAEQMQAKASHALMRFEIFLSRLDLLREPTPAAQIARLEGAAQITRVRELATRIEDLLSPPTPQSAEAALPLQLEAADLLHQIANKTATFDRSTRQETALQKRTATRIMLVSALGVFASGLIMAALLMHSLRGAQAAQSALASHRDALEGRINERTAELERALEQERRAKEVYRSFIITVSHQFRTPLAIIDMIVKRMVRSEVGDISPKAKAKLGRVLESSARLTELVNTFIETANVDADPKDFKLADLPLLPSLHQVLATFRERHPERLLILEAPPDAQDVRIMGDAKLLERAFSNILQNALNFSEKSKPVTISVQIDPDSVQIIVRDQGIGIPEHAQSQVFAPYYRAENAHVLPGVGMGLSLSRDIIRAHRGDVLLMSQQDVGSDVTITLPRPRRELHVEYP